ncbi:sigma 54-interacting transcriptional regulator [Clostridiaceae bacterium M8S5]|nr:sigma 54-interacting transcriptional regulator [Clostridiaceae bacterium M8S5]
MKTLDRVMNYLRETITHNYIKETSSNELGIDANEIEEKLGILRNNASTILNKLNKEGSVIKINSRPVRFILLEVLRNYSKSDIIKSSISQAELESIINKIDTYNPFCDLVGYDDSLKVQIGQAKAAIMYPSNGLHTLLLGETGVGKTTFATKMYEYAIEKKAVSNKEYPFISFNCADYYNNPQLLVSQLFGHKKGAFTGADIDKEGLVERANGGILFLDEVHRLPPDGQEMLFHFMDYGTFSRLGETQRNRKSNVLIIAATTENPNNTLLETFTRRIPVIITLPPFRNKSIKERVEIISALFRKEALRLKMTITLDVEALKALATSKCGGNIGRLYSEVKLTCAKAFLLHLQNKQGMFVKFSMLSRDIKNSVLEEKFVSQKNDRYLNKFSSKIMIKPTTHQIIEDQPEENLYDILSNKLEELKLLGYSDNEINIKINDEAHKYYDRMIKNYNFQNHNIRDLYRIIDENVVNITVELLQKVSNKLDKSLSNKLLFALSFHIQALLDRINNNTYIDNYDVLRNADIDTEYWNTGKEMVSLLNQKLNVNIPDSEIYFFSMLMLHEQDGEDKDKIGILIITHGENTATSMANVCNRLLNSNYVKALDMSLDSRDDQIYKKAFTMVKELDRGKGVLILADMGSAVNFGKRISNETGIITKTIDKVSTPLALEALRKIIYNDGDINELYNSLINKKPYEIKKNNVILSVCATGQGASMIAKTMLTEIIDNENIEDLKVITLDYSNAYVDSQEYKNINEKYNIVCCVGNLKPRVEIPFFHISEVLSETMRESFVKYLVSQQVIHTEHNKKNIYKEAEKILEKNLLFLNIPIAISYIKQVIESLSNKITLGDEKNIFNIVMHVSCMIERLTRNNIALYEGVKEYIKENEFLYSNIKSEINVLERIYQINIPDDEIAYIIKIINLQK